MGSALFVECSICITFFISAVVIYMYNKKLKKDNVQLFIEDGNTIVNIDEDDIKIICK